MGTFCAFGNPVRKVTRPLGYQVKSYIEKLKDDAEERQRFIEALTVHTTSFFREVRQYNWMRDKALPALKNERTKITLWSAACSTGQEGWSALMVIDEYRRKTGSAFNYSLIGTDVSRYALNSARRAIHPECDLKDVPDNLVTSYFLRSKRSDGRHRIVPELRNCAQWQQANLVTGQGVEGFMVDIAFLRNVLIYFPVDVQQSVIDRVVRRINPGGYLFTGHSECGFSHPKLEQIQPSIYAKLS